MGRARWTRGIGPLNGEVGRQNPKRKADEMRVGRKGGGGGAERGDETTTKVTGRQERRGGERIRVLQERKGEEKSGFIGHRRRLEFFFFFFRLRLGPDRWEAVGWLNCGGVGVGEADLAS